MKQVWKDIESCTFITLTPKIPQNPKWIVGIVGKQKQKTLIIIL